MASRLLLPSLGLMAMRSAIRQFPELRATFLPSPLLNLSRRFGALYAGALIGLALGWVVISPNFLPDTELGAWLVFGPMLIGICCGVFLGVLLVARWAMDD